MSLPSEGGVVRVGDFADKRLGVIRMDGFPWVAMVEVAVEEKMVATCRKSYVPVGRREKVV